MPPPPYFSATENEVLVRMGVFGGHAPVADATPPPTTAQPHNRTTPTRTALHHTGDTRTAVGHRSPRRGRTAAADLRKKGGGVPQITEQPSPMNGENRRITYHGSRLTDSRTERHAEVRSNVPPPPWTCVWQHMGMDGPLFHSGAVCVHDSSHALAACARARRAGGHR